MARKSPQREERLTRVAEMMLARPGISAAQIARELGVHRATAWRDVQEVRRQWAERRLQAYESRLLDDLARTDRAIEALWTAIEAGKGWAIDRLCSLIQTRMKLLGLDTVRHEIDIGEVLAKYLSRLGDESDGPAPAP